ncbi:alpha/beta-hydrolase [Zopfia rhizophila CBS 207.26]|uniref:Carboxylic ester hydrolase n=1 Tax=Zopfia rhizophila CBS 207.26 TaxID=1314779 RepID=A0A6A6EWE4_9PEZI|nr:alpha/beta-hydrolase [Zopfia rhizophila CBS 207.26]
MGISSRLAIAGAALLLNSAAIATTEKIVYSEPGNLPIVDLGYELHQETGDYYNFTNIRYAAPSLGNIPFALPQPPAVNRPAIETGSIGRAIAIQFLPQYLGGLPSNISTSGTGGVQAPQVDPMEIEDCLFLDFMVPRKLFHGYVFLVLPLKPEDVFVFILYTACFPTTNEPLEVWIYGGSYATGDKATRNSGNPAGLLRRSNNSIIYWVQKHIAKFGGDPDRVTVMGGSAGAGSIMHQITVFYNPEPSSLLQSPGYFPNITVTEQERTFSIFLTLLNVSTFREARQLPSNALMHANAAQVRQSPYGTYTFGPTIDGDFVPALPSTLFLHGGFDAKVKVMVGHNADEGILFTSPFSGNDTAFVASIRSLFPTMTADTLNYITQMLYPAGDAIILCNKYYLHNAYQDKTYSYKFSVPPGLHGVDISYTFYNDNGLQQIDLTTLTSLVSVEAAYTFQYWITTFATNDCQ